MFKRVQGAKYRHQDQLQCTGEQVGTQEVTLLYSFFHRDAAGHGPIRAGRERLLGCSIDFVYKR